ncbi:NAD(+) diphosphatase [Rhodocyclus tenuis]|uniref:NAD(+) diphosphatase n=1 Tax=Rhodocyclus tenuis TaxID=1066 RepID=UPI00190786A9|nr:NAD(+) diphosphatase [Rhodocyclus tenuis]MBK1679259.1 NADH pyrophosphatase [Rhodocyclus tenuis]
MNESSYWLLRCENRIFAMDSQSPATLFPCAQAADFGSPAGALLVGEWQGRRCYAADVASAPAHLAGDWRTLRALFGLGGGEAFALAGRATQLLDWQNNHRFCGRCATPTIVRDGEPAMCCPRCGLLAYPRISPAVMVLISRGNELLLARSPNFRPGVFSALAGFVEAGETLEQCAVREVREEVGLEITNLRYFHSQSWPFPNSLMLAFFADYAGGVITPQASEIEAADWFAVDALPDLPDQLSIARQLIDAWCRERGGQGAS